jgi:hypothetical protein
MGSNHYFSPYIGLIDLVLDVSSIVIFDEDMALSRNTLFIYIFTNDVWGKRMFMKATIRRFCGV